LAAIRPSATAASSIVPRRTITLLAVRGASGSRAAHASISPRRRLTKPRPPNVGSTWHLNVDLADRRVDSRHGWRSDHVAQKSATVIFPAAGSM
jgi:hypothetical protein